MRDLPGCFLNNCKALSWCGPQVVQANDKTLPWPAWREMAVNKSTSLQHRDWNKWLTASVGVATAIAGIIQFYYKEIFAPAKVPVNIALDLEIKPLDADPSGQKDIVTAMMQIKISNTGNKSVYLKSPIWIAYGMHRRDRLRDAGSFSIPTITTNIDPWCPKDTASTDPKKDPQKDPKKNPQKDSKKDLKKDPTEDQFVACLNQKLAGLAPDGSNQEFTDRVELTAVDAQRHSDHGRELIAMGPVGKSSELKPGQETRSHILVPVSKKSKYDYLEAAISVPTVSGVSADEANKISSVVYFNLQNPLPLPQKVASVQAKTYQKLRGFCLAKAKPWSLVDTLNAFRLSRYLGDGELGWSFNRKANDICYNSSKIPSGNFLERTQQFAPTVLSQDDLDRYGAQFYDATYEVPLQPLNEPSSSAQ